MTADTFSPTPVSSGYTVHSAPFTFRIAQTAEDVDNVKRLRYHVFYTEKGAKALGDMGRLSMDFDDFDDYAYHVMVENEEGELVGTVRLITRDNVPQSKNFYTEQFYNLDVFLDNARPAMELGRACIAKDYRKGRVLNLMWKYTMGLIRELNIELMFGCASFLGDDIKEHAHALSYMHYNYLLPAELQPTITFEKTTHLDLLSEDEVDTQKALAGIPPLIKGYLKLGGRVSDRAVVDHQFNTVFTCLFLDIDFISDNALLNRITKG